MGAGSGAISTDGGTSPDQDEHVGLLSEEGQGRSSGYQTSKLG